MPSEINILVSKLFQISFLFSVDNKNVFRFAHHYSDNMVLQRAPTQAIVWGYREYNQPVHVLIKGPKQTKYATMQHGTLPTVEYFKGVIEI